MTTVKDICDFLDEIMPFSLAEDWDNSGLLVSGRYQDVSCVMTCLDITSAVVEEAAEAGAQLIVSHHPVIFHPLKRIDAGSPVYRLIQKGIGAVCCHTNADAAACGTNGIAYDLLKDPLSLGQKETLVPSGEGAGIGWTAECREISADALASKLKIIFGGGVRYISVNRPIKRIGFCSGSGGSFLECAAKLGCTGYITGDVKHDSFVFGENTGMSIFDCGHYETEILFAAKTAEYLSERFPDVNVFASQWGTGYIRYK